MMKEYYCINLKFRDQSISNLTHHAHLYIKNEEILIRIFELDEIRDVDRRFSMSENALGYIDENFEIIDSENKILFNKSRIWKVTNSEFKDNNNFFTIYLTSVCVIKKK